MVPVRIFVSPSLSPRCRVFVLPMAPWRPQTRFHGRCLQHICAATQAAWPQCPVHRVCCRKWTSVYGSYFGAAEEVLADVRLAVAGVPLDERIRRGTLFPVRRYVPGMLCAPRLMIVNKRSQSTLKVQTQTKSSCLSWHNPLRCVVWVQRCGLTNVLAPSSDCRAHAQNPRVCTSVSVQWLCGQSQEICKKNDRCSGHSTATGIRLVLKNSLSCLIPLSPTLRSELHSL